MSKLSDIWRNNPLFRLILEELINRPAGISERELLDIIKREHGYEVSKVEFYHMLIKLELRGLVRAERISRELIIKISPEITRIIQ